MSTVPVYTACQIYGANGENFHRIVNEMLEDMPQGASYTTQDAAEFERKIRSMIRPFERLALITRLAAKEGVPYEEEQIEELRDRLAVIQSNYIEDSRLDYISSDLSARLQTAAGWLAQAICMLAIDNHPRMADTLAN